MQFPHIPYWIIAVDTPGVQAMILTNRGSAVAALVSAQALGLRLTS